MRKIVRKALVKYLCWPCEKEFLTQETSEQIEKNMSCPFCKGEVEVVAGPDSDAQDLYDDMGCFYPGGF